MSWLVTSYATVVHSFFFYYKNTFKIKFQELFTYIQLAPVNRQQRVLFYKFALFFLKHKHYKTHLKRMLIKSYLLFKVTRYL